MKSLIRRFCSEESGQVLALVSITLVVLCGLAAIVTDVGQLYLERQRLASAADLAALAGAQELPDREAAEEIAAAYLAKNGIDVDAVEIEISDDDQEVAVTLRNTIPTTFARILGVYSQGTWGGATARSAAVSGGIGAVPLGVARADWQVGQEVVLKLSANDGTVAPGNYQALALGKHGASMYEYNLMNGYDQWMRVGDWLETEPGNMAGPTVRATQFRINQDPHATWQTVQKGSPRLLMVPVLQDWLVNGRGEVQVVGFAMFFLDKVETKGSDKGEITGRFLRVLGEGEVDGVAPDFGLRAVKLIR